MSFSQEVKRELKNITETKQCCKSALSYGLLLNKSLFEIDKAKQAIKQDCCKRAFLRGALIGTGYISDPAKGYRVDFSVSAKVSADVLYSALRHYKLSPKRSEKTAKRVCLHGKQPVHDFLGHIGADTSYWEMLGTVIEKEIRNNANRATNCDSANITKTITAASKQISAINELKRKNMLDNLQPELIEIARLRVENPEMSLKELGENLSSPLSRSGVNHRLNKLVEVANQ